MRTRKDERLVTSLSARASIPGTDIAVTILDISTTGCRIATGDHNVAPGTTILITIGDDEVASGQVAWQRDGECGVKFHRDLTVALVDRIASVIS